MEKILSYLIAITLYNIAVAQSQANYGNNAAAGKYCHVNGINMYYEVYGSGEPVLLIHGNGGSIKAFKENIAALSQHFTVIAADSRAQGKTIDHSDSLSFEMMADDEAALLKKLHLNAVNVIGWSDGGIVALEMAIRHPESVIRLMSTGANLWPDSTAIIPSLWKEEKITADTTHTEHFDLKQKNDWKLFMLDYTQPNITLSQLQQIKCPALIIGGDNDLIRTEHTVLIAQHIPNAFLWIVPNSHHATLMEHKDEFNQTAIAFFSGGMIRKP
ncbi:MAG: alpha/beta hydrolase [Bacteroidota bacterium]|nr:alpha/beta hydrolase [Bacteroidota bacterium]